MPLPTALLLQAAETPPTGELLGGGVALAAGLLALASLVLLPALLRALPPDYFSRLEAPPTPFAARHPQARLLLAVLRNGVGALLLAAGIAMLVLPGQGLLTILAALVLLEFPGKRRLELSLVRRRSVFRSLNWLRRRTGRPPFDPPPPARSEPDPPRS